VHALTQTREPQGDITVCTVVRGAVTTYRRHFTRLALAAVVIFAPAMALDSALERLVPASVQDTGDWYKLLVAVASAVAFGGTLTALTFFAGVLDRLVATERYGHPWKGLGGTLRHLPLARLVGADLLVWGIVSIGELAFVLPGVVAELLFCIVGPVIIIEDAGVLRALRRSARLMAPRWPLAVWLVLLPLSIESYLARRVGGWLHDSIVAALLVEIVLAIVVGAVVGLLEITMAHELVAADRSIAGPGSPPQPPRGAGPMTS